MRITFAICLSLAASTAFATPPDTYGFGVRSNSLAGAVTADVSDTSANYYNPAGLVHDGALRIAAWYANSQPLLEINGQESSVERHGALNVGLVAPATFGDLRLAFGLALHLPEQRVARTRSTIVDRPRWELYDTRSHRLFLATSLAIQVAPWLRLGAGIAFQSASVLTLELRGDVNPFAATETRLEHSFRGDLSSIRYPQAGVQIQPHDRFEIGITFRDEYELANTIIALADATISRSALLLFGLDTESVSLFGPRQLAIGFAARPIDGLRLSFDFTWYDWSRHPSLIALQDITIETDLMGLGIPDEITALPPIDPEMKDTFVPRFGIELTPVSTERHRFDLRAGYAFERSPFPTQRGITNFVDGDKHTVSFGLGIAFTDLEPTLPGSLHLDAFVQYSRIAPRDHIKDSLVDPVGDYTAEGHLIQAGFGLEVAFE